MVSDNVALLGIGAMINYFFIYKRNKFLGSVTTFFLGLGSLIITKNSDNSVFSLILMMLGIFSILMEWFRETG